MHKKTHKNLKKIKKCLVFYQKIRKKTKPKATP